MDAPDLYPELDDQLDTLTHDLDLDGPELAETVVSSGMFHIDSIEKANWALSKIGRHQARVAEAEAEAKRMRERIDLWLEGERRQAERRCVVLEALLRLFHEHRVRAGEPKTKRLPAGVLAARKIQDTWVVDDPKALLEWARTPTGPKGLIRFRDPEVDKAAVKKLLAPADGPGADGMSTVLDPMTGEIAPGVRVHVARDDELTFKATPNVGEVDR